MKSNSTHRSPATRLATHHVFQHVASVCVVTSGFILVFALFLPAADIGGLVEGEEWVVPGIVCFAGTLVSPGVGIFHVVLLLSTPLLLRKWNGMLWVRSFIVSAYLLWSIYTCVTYTRDLYPGFYCWLTAVTIGVSAHWLTLVGTSSRFGVPLKRRIYAE